MSSCKKVGRVSEGLVQYAGGQRDSDPNKTVQATTLGV